MAKKRLDGDRFIEAALTAIKAESSPRELYVAIFGIEPDRLELQKFINRLNPVRSNPSTDFLGMCVMHSKHLKTVTLAEFFGLDDPDKS